MAVRAVHRSIGRKVGVAFLSFGIALLSGLVPGSPSARASYYYPTYNGYGSYGYGGYGSQSPVISIDMDPRHQLDSAFRVAAREGRLEDMMALVREGADVDSISDEGNTALMYASRNCSLEVASELVRLKANANLRNKEGDTALIFASMESCLPVVKLLMRTPRLNLTARDRQGKTALDYAREGAVLEVDGPEARIAQILLSRVSRTWSAKGSPRPGSGRSAK